jgi:uncharacterized protein YjbJ (UPF0337 family)
MNNETIKGVAEKLEGKLKEAAGDISNNDRLKAEGQADQVKGGAREAVGHAKDASADAVDYLKSKP